MDAMRRNGSIRAQVGSMAGGVIAFLAVAVPIAPVISDHENGFWHDPDGWLIWVAILVGMLGAMVGCWLALRLGGYDTPIATALLLPLLWVGAGLVGWILSSVWMWLALTILSPVAARAVTPSRAKLSAH